MVACISFPAVRRTPRPSAPNRSVRLIRSSVLLHVLIGLLPLTRVAAAPCPSPPDSIWAGTSSPMTYSLRDDAGHRVLLAKGAIGTDEHRKLESAIAKAGRIDEIWFYSPGGSSAAGMEMGRVIKRRGLATRVPRGAVCFSACSMAFLGGVLRSVDPGGFYGVHMWTAWKKNQVSKLLGAITERLENKSYPYDALVAEVTELIQSIERDNAQYARKRADYLLEMSVSLRLMIPNTNTPSAGEYYICGSEARSYNVVNVD